MTKQHRIALKVRSQLTPVRTEHSALATEHQTNSLIHVFPLLRTTVYNIGNWPFQIECCPRGASFVVSVQ
jgi:hypothetical protein